jgi:hypothetical protein
LRGLELRDVEILRALLRVRYLTTRQIKAAFFSCPRVGRRRVHRLSEYDLIRPHTKGLPEVLRYTAWRLTGRGLEVVAAAFPDGAVGGGRARKRNERGVSGSMALRGRPWALRWPPNGRPSCSWAGPTWGWWS